MKQLMMAVVGFALALGASGCSACGYTAKDGELIGQVKGVHKATPIVCGDYVEADISLGVLRNGTGSMSKDDVTILVRSEDILLLQEAAKSGQLVKIHYDERRVTVCIPNLIETSIELLPFEGK